MELNRRRFLQAGGTAALMGTAGCDAPHKALWPYTGLPDEAKPRESGAPATESEVWESLKQVYDPEIPVNIVDLGLVYDLVIDELPDGGGKQVKMKMTLTAPGCGMGPAIAADAQNRILSLPGIDDASVEVVWDPPWHQSMISEEGKKTLGIA